MAKGAAWMVLFRLFDRSIGLVSTATLARLLVPADFGLVAMAMSVVAVIELATAFNFEVALIQKADPGRAHFDTAWTLNILMALACAVLTAALAYPAAELFGDPRLTAVMFAIGAAWFVSGFENVGTVHFRRKMDFAADFRLMATKRLIAFVVTMVAALVFRSYWALVIGMATGRIAGMALSYLMQPFRPRFSLACAGEMFSFSGWMLMNNIATVILGRVPHFIVGRLFGAQALGAYTVGSEIAQLAHTELVAPINRAMFPGYSRLVDDPDAFRRTCIEASSAVLLVIVPVSVGIAVLAEPVVRILLGSGWGEAVPVIQVLAVAGAVSAQASNMFAAYLALGRPHLPALVLVFKLALLSLAAFAFTQGQGMLGVAYAELVAAIGSLAISWPVLMRTMRISFGEFAAVLWRPVVASASVGMAVSWLRPQFESGGTLGAAALQLLVCVPLGALAYLLLLWALWRFSGRPECVETLMARRVLANVRWFS